MPFGRVSNGPAYLLCAGPFLCGYPMSSVFFALMLRMAAVRVTIGLVP